MSLARKILDYQFSLIPPFPLPPGIDWLMPYEDEETRRCMTVFYQRYYWDQQPRTFILGINPGRFGAGVTGVPFTDPVRLEKLGIENSFSKRQELSSVFIYEMIDAYGGPEKFYSTFYIASLSPLGFVKHGKNYNYYDDKILAEIVQPYIIQNLSTQSAFGANSKKVFCLGQGQNNAWLQKLNDQHQWWESVVPLPHPRWVMQYKLRKKDEYISLYLEALTTEQ